MTKKKKKTSAGLFNFAQARYVHCTTAENNHHISCLAAFYTEQKYNTFCG